MCFAAQRRALFRYLNFQKWFFRHLNFQEWSENDVFCTLWLGSVLRATAASQGVFYTIWLGNVLRAATASTFSTSQLPKVVREWCVCCTF